MHKNEKVKIRNVIIPDDIAAIRKLWFDYLVFMELDLITAK